MPESQPIDLSVVVVEESLVQHEKSMPESQPINLSVVVVEESLVQHENKVVLMMKNDDEIRPWADLLSDLLHMILSRLFEFDRIRFRLTCKAWLNSAIRFPSHLYLSSIPKFPWLMHFSKPKNQGDFNFFNPITNETYFMKIPQLANALFRGSRFGWVLMSRGRHSLFFYNPFIPGSTIEIPDFTIAPINFVSITFTAPPFSSDCIVYAQDPSPIQGRVVIYRWCYGDDSWTEYYIDCPLFETAICSPVFYEGVFYQPDIHGRLGVLNPKKANDKHLIMWKGLPQSIAKSDINRQYCMNYIAECDGELVCVFVVDGGHTILKIHKIDVFKLDWSKMEWVTMQSLGNKAMFIGESGSLLIETNGGGAENKIYFPRFVNKEGGEYREGPASKNAGVFYCLETRRYHTFESGFSSEDWIGTRGVQNYTWI